MQAMAGHKFSVGDEGYGMGWGVMMLKCAVRKKRDIDINERRKREKEKYQLSALLMYQLSLFMLSPSLPIHCCNTLMTCTCKEIM